MMRVFSTGALPYASRPSPSAVRGPFEGRGPLCWCVATVLRKRRNTDKIPTRIFRKMLPKVKKEAPAAVPEAETKAKALKAKKAAL